MGSYSHFTFDDYPLYEFKNGYYDGAAHSIFINEDFITEERKNKDRNKLIWGDIFEGDNSRYTFKGFRQTVKICKERLEIYGYNSIKAKKEYQKAIKAAKRDEYYEFPIEEISYEEYLVTIKEIIKTRQKTSDGNTLTFFDTLLSSDLSIYEQSVSCHLYSVLSVLPDNAIIECDLTEIIAGGWTSKKEIDIAQEKIIILTEGKTDVEFISACLAKQYPHLISFYHFINFDAYNVESSASALVKLVISLIAANIKHPIIVLFDNDTAGIMEMKKLMQHKLAHNFKILKYPDLLLAKKYPTIGPTGLKKMNVNNVACSIEMYFGENILTKDDTLIPVQWKGYNDKEKKYQGEISDKKYVQELFRKTLKASDTIAFSNMDFILKAIFDAYE